MVRQISGSTPNASATSAEPIDLGTWLTRELRVKGAPMQPPSPAESVRSSERPSEAPFAAPPERSRSRRERESLASWLTRDLVPKRSGRARDPGVLPESEAPSVRREPFLKDDAIAAASAEPRSTSEPSVIASSARPVESTPAAVRPAVAAVPTSNEPESPGASVSTGPRDGVRGPLATSLASAPGLGRERPSLRDVVPSLERPAALERPVALALEAPLPTSPLGGLGEVRATDTALAKSSPPPALAPLALEEDDLAVLPGHRRASGTRRAKLALALLLGLLVLGSLIVVRFNTRSADEARASAGDRPPMDNGVLLPPPPSSDALPAAPEPAAAPPTARRASAQSSEPEEPMDPRDPRFMRGGPNVRRYADVPSPTLSRLAREQRRLARERDEAVRNAKPAEATP